MSFDRISLLLNVRKIESTEIPTPETHGETNYNRQDGEYNSHYGKKHSSATKRLLSDLAKQRWAVTPHPRKGVKLTQEHKDKLSEAHKGRPSHRKGTEPWNKGLHHSPATKSAISASKTGQPRSDETRLAISNGSKNRIKLTCVYCGKTLDASNIARWHNDKCKHK